MIKYLAYRYWGITSRMVFITIVPIVFMCMTTVIYSFYSRSQELQQELDERGHLICDTLSESSEYGVISGNIFYLNKVVSNLLQKDPSISKIEIRGKLSILVSMENKSNRGNASGNKYSANIIRKIIPIDNFEEQQSPHVSADSLYKNQSVVSEVIGSVVVTMSPVTMMEKQRTRIYIAIALSICSLIISSLIGLTLGHGLTNTLVNVISTLRQIRQGNYDVDIHITDRGEIGELQNSVIEVAESLNHYKNEMEDEVMVRTSALEHAMKDAIKSNEEKRKLIQKVNSVVEDERQTIALEIHDQLNASLIVIRLEAERIRELAGRNHTIETSEKIKLTANSVIENTAGLYKMARDIVKRLRPEIIDTLGLRDAVHEMVSHYDSISPDCDFLFKSTGDFSNIQADLAITAYRLVQEALSNIVKHARATSVAVAICVEKDNSSLHINVVDNGEGFVSDEIEPGVGLIGMRERVFVVGGTVLIDSTVGTGTRIIINIPTSYEKKESGRI